MINKRNIEAALIGLIATVASGIAAAWLGADISAVSRIEWLAVITSFSSTYLCVMQSRSNYIWGAISVALYTYLFYTSSLFSSAILNAYLFPVLTWGWFRWGPDDSTRKVEFVQAKWWPAYLGFAAVTWFVLSRITSGMGAALASTDSLILVLSILAQSLLDQKKPENWAVWAIVNVIAIYTYWSAGLHLVAIQYLMFLVNTIVGGMLWVRSMRGAAA